jgi:hypothetical protein
VCRDVGSRAGSGGRRGRRPCAAGRHASAIIVRLCGSGRPE